MALESLLDGYFDKKTDVVCQGRIFEGGSNNHIKLAEARFQECSPSYWETLRIKIALTGITLILIEAT